jgi:hypothetical protein
MQKIYIASPYTLGSEGENVRISLDAANELINEGYAPFAPLLAHFQHMIYPQSYEVWMSLDIEWIGVCDAVLRLPGDSSGADREVEYARNNSIPVFYKISQIVEYYDDLDAQEL